MTAEKKRKKIVTDNHRQTVSKRIKTAFEKILNSVESSGNNDRERSVDNTRSRNLLDSWMEEARQNEIPILQVNEEPVRGQERKFLKDLKERDDYVKINAEGQRGIDFFIRRGTSTTAEALHIKESDFNVTVRTSRALDNVTIAGFLSALWDVFDVLFTEAMESGQYDEICFHVTHKELEGSLSTAVYELKEENREAIIYEIMSRLTGWNQSANPSAAVKHLGISVTLLKRNLPGQGVLLAVGDDNLRKKGFSRQNFNGSLFYVDSEKDCFFISIYFGMIYNSYSKFFELAKTATEKKRVQREMYDLIEMKGSELQQTMRNFFMEQFQIDVDQYESGSVCFLKELTFKSQCQVAIFSDKEGFKRILMVPEVYEPALEHVSILLTQYVKETEPRKTVRKEAEYFAYHYHGIRITCRGFVGQNQSFCVYCGVYYSYTNSFHGCKNNALLCSLCARPEMTWLSYREMSEIEKTNFCVQAPDSLTLSGKMECSICKKKAKSALCLEIHARQKCRDRIRCEKCSRVIRLVGKYSEKVKDKPVKCHEDCEEVFCTICNDYVDGFDDLKNPSHVCYVPTITKSKMWPSLMVSFDFETFPCDKEGTMKANMVHMIYQAEENNSAADFRGIFFTDVPMEGVELNGQQVKPGVEYSPDLTEDLKEYYSFEQLKAELEENETATKKKWPKIFDKSEKDKEINNHTNDAELCHFLRNPEVVDLNVQDAVKAHLDIYNFQVNREIAITEKSKRNDVTSVKEEKVGWRQKLQELHDMDKELVDKIKHARDQTNEDEANEEEAEFQKNMKKFVRRKKKRNPFILTEAAVDKEDTDSDEESVNLTSRQSSLQEDGKFFKNCIFYPTEESGDVPGCKKRTQSEAIDFPVYQMSKEENVKKLQQECENPFPSCNGEVKSKPQTAVKRFCSHESEEDYEKRIDILEKTNDEQKSNCLKQFCLYILQPKFQNAVFLGMYSSGFDNHFVFMQMIELGVRVNPVFKGNKLLTFCIPALNIRFLDFFCYVPSSLKKLEKSFNLKTGSKGYFPHLLNLPENYGLSLPHLPPKFFYETEMMRAEDLKDFEKWYSENYEKKFVFCQELLSYCELDVKILMAASLTFVKETLVQQTEFVGKVRKLKPNGQSVLMKTRTGEIKTLMPNLIHVFSAGLCTLSSYVNTVFRSFYLEEKTLPMITHDVEENYSARSSRLEMEVLTYIKNVKKVTDLEFGNHFRGQRRFTVVCPETEKARTFYVDGYCPKTKTVYEILGCVFHGCFKCFRPDDKLKQGLENVEAVRLTDKRLRLLKLHEDVTHIKVIKECDWKMQRTTDPEVIDFLKTFSKNSLFNRRLSLKETFRGGLVEPFCVAFDAEKVTEMAKEKFGKAIPDPYGKLVDINSMYPAQLMPSYSYSTTDVDYVMCPVNGSKILRGNLQCTEKCNQSCILSCGRVDKHTCEENVKCFTTCKNHHPPDCWGKLPGFALVKILPPKDQRFPILRMRLTKGEGSKNFSTLCRTCALEGNAFEGLKNCSHADEERCLFGEFSTAELKFAIEKQGYILKEVFEVQFFCQYSLTMFQNLLKSFYMLKVASKGYDEKCSTETEKFEFLQKLREDCGFGSELQEKHIKYNPAGVTVAKLSANALVGKLGQSQNRPNKKVVTDHSEVSEIRNSRYFTISSVKLINSRSAVLSYKPMEDRIKPYKYGCLVVPSLVTAFSRMYLTRLATSFERNFHVVAYCDTDSLLAFAIHPEAPSLSSLCQISERLGCLKVERDGIKKFFSTAAKTYSVETVTGELTIKAKGFNILEKLLKDNNNACLLEKNVKKMFSAVAENTNKPDSSVLVFQKQIKVNPVEMVPALIPREKSFKLLNFIGPRRQIDLSNWLDFTFERVNCNENLPTKVDSLEPAKPIADGKSDYTFECTKQQNNFVCRDNSKLLQENFQVQLVPQVRGLLPALPYGFDISNLKDLLFFYNLTSQKND